MQARKAGIVGELSGGIGALFKANNVTGLFGRGRLLPDNKVQYTPHDGEPELLEAEHVILATGRRRSSCPPRRLTASGSSIRGARSSSTRCRRGSA